MSDREGDRGKEPIITLRLIGFLVLVAVLSGGLSYLYKRSAENRKKNPALKNPNVVPLKPMPIEEYMKEPLSPEHKYISKHVHPYISEHQGPIKDCYFGYRGKEKIPPKGAKVTVQIFVAPDGTVKKAEIFHSELKIKEILSCIISEIKKWRFPPHNFTKQLRFQYPFFFR